MYTDKIIGNARVARTYRGYEVWVRTCRRPRATLAEYFGNNTNSKKAAYFAAFFIDKGDFITTKNGGIIKVQGDTLSVEY